MMPSTSILPTPARPLVFPMQRLLQTVRSAWQWLELKRGQQLTARRMRVAETVSLGEKRFVSIIKVDGVEMLIGVSGANVSLLTILKPEPVFNVEPVFNIETAFSAEANSKPRPVSRKKRATPAEPKS